ncbi:MAG: tetratricopeptide repeat protein [Myxococcales bacterium]|nr:tetratricopeptide repeat protein [Myxococcales bacterium]
MEFPRPFGRYQLLEPLAQGGMAEVFLARSVGLEGFEKRLVIKRILPDLARNPRFVSLFIHEAKLSVALTHPNIVQVFELGKVDDDPYLAMEFIHGADLTHVLRALRRDERRMPVAVAVAIGAAISRGLAYAHSRRTAEGVPLQIVHRDVSPHNVMVSFEGEVKLVDFGIARLAATPETEGVDPHSLATQHVGVSAAADPPRGGKFAYMSPEQANGERLDGRSDLYAVGIVLYEMLAGRRLYEGTPEDKLRALTSGVLPDLQALNPDVPDDLVAIVHRALALDVNARYPTGTELDEDLRAFQYRHAARAGGAQIAALMKDLFPNEALGGRMDAGLRQLVADLDAMHTGVEPDRSAMSILDTAVSHQETPAFRSTPSGEHRSIVVLTAEANGLTDHSVNAESEDIARIHIRMLRGVRELVVRLGGVADRYDDDTLRVFFGLPRSLGDDLDRALICAGELHRLAERQRKKGLAVEFAIAVHVGDLTVARPIGNRYRYAAHGDTLKMPQRLAWAAEPGTTLVSEKVAALAGDRYPFEPGPALRRKGGRAMQRTFVLAGGRRAGGRGSSGGWLRRADELEVMRDAIARLRDGLGTSLCVVGEAGVGKSRFFAELRDLAQRRSLLNFHARAAPFSTRPFSATRDLLADILGIRDGASAAVTAERLTRLGGLGLDGAESAVISALFQFELGPPKAAAAGPSRRAPHRRPPPPREAIFSACAHLIAGICREGPVMLMLEDVQHLDDAEAELFAHLLRVCVGQPVMLLASWRTDEDGARFSGLVPVRLAPLPPEQAGQFASALLGATAIGPDLTRLLLRTAEGNPLYLEEILKALRQGGRIWYEGSTARLKDPHLDPGLPDTLQGLVDARIDALEPGARGALQVAAVIGFDFSAALLGAALGAEDPTPIVGELVRGGLIAPESPVAGTQYAFRSVLIWEAVLRGILAVQRREYHRLVASGMERQYAGRLDAMGEAWATHAHAGGRIRDAAASLLRVAELEHHAERSDRALECLQRALAWLERGPRTEKDPMLEASLHLLAGELSLLLGRPRTLAHLEVALDIAGEIGPPEVEARAMLALGKLHHAQGRTGTARMHLESALETLAARAFAGGGGAGGSSGPGPEQRSRVVDALEALAAIALQEGKPEEAQQRYAEGLVAAGDDASLAARVDVGQAVAALRRGEMDTAEALLRAALPLAEAAKDRILQGRILNNLGLAAFQRGSYHDALDAFRKALEVRAGLGYRQGEAVNLHNIGDAWMRLGDDGRAFTAFEESREIARTSGLGRFVAMNDVYLCYLRALRAEGGAELELNRAVAACKQVGDAETALMGRLFLARLAHRRGEDIAHVLEQVRTEAERLGLRGLEREIGGTGPQEG